MIVQELQEKLEASEHDLTAQVHGVTNVQ